MSFGWPLGYVWVGGPGQILWTDGPYVCVGSICSLLYCYVCPSCLLSYLPQCHGHPGLVGIERLPRLAPAAPSPTCVLLADPGRTTRRPPPAVHAWCGSTCSAVALRFTVARDLQGSVSDSSFSSPIGFATWHFTRLVWRDTPRIKSSGPPTRGHHGCVPRAGCPRILTSPLPSSHKPPVGRVVRHSDGPPLCQPQKHLQLNDPRS